MIRARVPLDRRGWHRPLLIFHILLLVSLGCSMPGLFGKPQATITPSAQQTAAQVQPTSPPTPLPTPLPPALVETSPPPGAEIPLLGPITLYFNQAMDRASVEGALSVGGDLGGQPNLPGQFDWASDAVLSYVPAQPFLPETRLAVTVGENARSLQGLPLSNPITLDFRTVGYLRPTQVLPEPDSSDVNVTSAIVAAFNRPVVPLGDTGAPGEGTAAGFQISPQPAGRGEWLNTSTYIFYPEPALAGGVEYTVSLNPDLTGLDGSPLVLEGEDVPSSWTFTTALPGLSAISPEPGMTFVPIDARIALTFTQPMDPESVAESFSLLDLQDQPVPGEWAWNEDETGFLFDPDSLLDRGSQYTMILLGSVQGWGGGAPGSDTQETFFTVPNFDVLSTDPVHGSTSEIYEPVVVHFSAPLSSTEEVEGLRLEPEVDMLSTWGSPDGRSLYLHGVFQPDTDYTLTLPPNTADRWGQTLGRAFSFSFRTLSRRPELFLTSYSGVLFLTPQDETVPLQAVNLESVSYTLGSLPIEDFMVILGPGGYDLRQTYRPADQTLFQEPLELTPNQVEPVNLPLTKTGSGLEPGLYYLRFNFNQNQIFAEPFLFAVSNVHLTYKITSDEVMVWAVDLRTQEPVANAPVSVYTEEGQLLTGGLTDAEGVFQAGIPTQENLYQVTFAVLGRPGEDNFSLVLSDWSQGISAWDYGLLADYQTEQVQNYIYTDRPIYRPGQTVYFRVISRQVRNGRYQLPEAGEIGLPLYNGIGEQLTSFDLPLTAFGSAHGSYQLPSDAQPGVYSLGEGGGTVRFRVSEYRKPEIDLQVSFTDGEILAGQPLSAQVNARYFFDAPVGNLPLHWTLFAEPVPFEIPGYQVGLADMSWMEVFQITRFLPGFGIQVAEGESQTSPDGTQTIDLPAASEEMVEAGRLRYTLEVTAQDESGLPLSSRASVVANPAPYHIGVKPGTWTALAGREIGFDVLVVDWNARPAGRRSLSAEFSQVEYILRKPSATEQLQGITPTFIPQYTPMAATQFTTGEDGVARLSYTPPDPGIYQLEISGDGTRSQVLLWAGGPGQVVWPELPNQRLRLTLDRETYRPGDTARVFVPNPLGGQVLALLTIERAAIMRHQILSLSGSGTELSIPVEELFAPNVYLSVTLLGRGAGDQLDFRQGYTNLIVEPVQHELNVEVLASGPTGEAGRAGPGEPVDVLLRVSDASGNPVQGEFSVSLIDKAVLALAEPNSAEILQAFYGMQSLGVRTALSLAGYVNRSLSSPGGMGGGGDEDLATAVVRENFPDTAYWNAEVLTDANGEASLSLTLPDNLTTWLVDVRGVDQDTRVGQASLDLITTKEFLVRPVTPRFLVVLDHLQLAAVVQNNTSTDLQAEVTLQSSGFTLDETSPATQLVSVPGGGRVQVTWWGTVSDAEEVDLVFAATAGDLQDAARPALGALPVLRYTAPFAYGTSGVLTEAEERLELVSLPATFDPLGGQLRLELAPSLGAALLNGLDALERTLYESNEVVLSRFLANLETYRALQSFGLAEPDLQERLNAKLSSELVRLVSRQKPDGSWSWWPSGKLDAPGDVHLTAYVLFGLSRAREAGLNVSEEVLRQAGDYLLATLVSPDMASQDWQLDRLAFVHFALMEAGYGDPSGAASLYERRDRLSSWAKALLALTLSELTPSGNQAQTLLSDLQATASRSASGAHWETEGFDPQNFTTSIFSTAVVVYTLARLEPASALLPDAVRYLMAHRQATGGWSTSYETTWTLLAVAEVMKGTGELGGSFEYSADLNGLPVASGQAGEAIDLSPVAAEIPIQNLYPDTPNALVIQRSEGPGRLYYSASLQVSQPAELVSPLNRGASLTRRYYPLTQECQEGSCQPVSEGLAGERYLVRLTLALPQDAYYFMVQDFIPAGSEILDLTLKTSEMAGQELVEPLYQQDHPFGSGWGYWLFHEPQVFDDRIAWAADYLPAGTYELTYTLSLLQPGEYRVLPAQAWQVYFPDVQGNSAGEVFIIREPERE